MHVHVSVCEAPCVREVPCVRYWDDDHCPMPNYMSPLFGLLSLEKVPTSLLDTAAPLPQYHAAAALVAVYISISSHFGCRPRRVETISPLDPEGSRQPAGHG